MSSYKYVVHSVQEFFLVVGSSYVSNVTNTRSILTLCRTKIYTLMTSIGFEATVDNRPAIKLALIAKN